MYYFILWAVNFIIKILHNDLNTPQHFYKQTYNKISAWEQIKQRSLHVLRHPVHMKGTVQNDNVPIVDNYVLKNKYRSRGHCAMVFGLFVTIMYFSGAYSKRAQLCFLWSFKYESSFDRRSFTSYRKSPKRHQGTLTLLEECLQKEQKYLS